MSPEMTKKDGSLNGLLCAYLKGQKGRTSIIELVRDLRAMNALATFQNDPWKFTDVRAQTVIFHVQIWKMRKKIAKIFMAIMKKPGTSIDDHV